MSLLRRLCAWLDPRCADESPDMDAAEAARVAGIQAETARRLQGGLHARKADRSLREAREELDKQKARVAQLDIQAEVRGRRVLGNE